jgi:hypothetical protein
MGISVKRGARIIRVGAVKEAVRKGANTAPTKVPEAKGVA